MKTLLAAIFLSTAAHATVDVSSLATAGNGSAATPWVGWDSTAWQPETQYKWPSGIYEWSGPLNLLQTGIVHVGEAGTVLKFTGCGNAVTFDNPGGLTPNYLNWTQNVRFENFIVQGSACTTNGLFMRGVRNAIVQHVSVRDVSESCLRAEALVTNVFQNFRCTHHEMPNDTFNVRPAYGIVLDARGPDTTTTSLFNNAVIEGTGVAGIWVKAGSYANRFTGGTSEGNLGKGMQLDSWLNVVDGMDFEANGGTDIEVNHSSNEIRAVYAGGLVDVRAGQMNKMRGRFQAVRIANNVDYADINGAYIGTLADFSQSTIKYGYQTLAGNLISQSFVGNVMNVMKQISVVGGIVSTNAFNSSTFWFGIFGPTLLANPTNPYDGQPITWRVQQSAAGGNVLSYDTAFESASGLPLPMIDPTPSRYTYITARYNAQRAKWQFP